MIDVLISIGIAVCLIVVSGLCCFAGFLTWIMCCLSIDFYRTTHKRNDDASND